MNNFLVYIKQCSEQHEQLATAGMVGVASVGLVVLLKGFYSLQHSYRFKYPESVKNSDSFTQTLHSDPERALVDLSRTHPDECTVTLQRSWLGLTDRHVVFLNSMDAVNRFTRKAAQSEAIGNRPRNVLLNMISRGYLGSFFRMYDDKLNEVRKTSSAGLHALIGPHSDFEDKLNVEVHAFTDFFAKENIADSAQFDVINKKYPGAALVRGKSCVIENANIYAQQFSTNILVTLGLGARFPYELAPDAAVKQQIANMTALLSSLNVVELAQFDTVMNQRAVKDFVAGKLESVYGFLSGVIGAYAKGYDAKAPVRTFADLVISKQIEHVKEAGGKSLPASENYSDEDILVQVFTLLMAGANTTGFSLAWSLYYLATHPSIQARIFAEISALSLGTDELLSQRTHHAKLPFVDATINEVLRMSSLQTLIPRATRHACTVVGDYVLPNETPVVINAYAIHHDARAWPEPDQFKPERWLDASGQCDSTKASTSGSFIAFGIAPRNCIGQVLARNILFVFISNVVKQFELEYVPKDTTTNGSSVNGVMRRPHDFHLKITRRS